MKRIFITLLGLMALVSSSQAKAPQQKLDRAIDSSRVVTQSKRLLRLPKIGRFDRGITNYKFIEKGSKLFSLTASYSSYESDNSTLLALLQNLDYNLNTTTVNAAAGYFYRDNNMVGVKFGYSNLSTALANSSLQIEGLDFSITEVSLDQRVLTSALIHRSYVGMDRKGRFGLFNETALSFTTGNSNFTRKENGDPKVTDTRITQFDLGISPGVSVFVMQNVSAEVSFGIVGFKYRKEDQDLNGEPAGSYSKSGANFKVNLLSINIGVTVCI